MSETDRSRVLPIPRGFFFISPPATAAVIASYQTNECPSAVRPAHRSSGRPDRAKTTLVIDATDLFRCRGGCGPAENRCTAVCGLTDRRHLRSIEGMHVYASYSYNESLAEPQFWAVPIRARRHSITLGADT